MSTADTDARLITDPDLGRIGVELDRTNMRITVTFLLEPDDTDHWCVGWTYEDPAVLTARWVELTDDTVLLAVQSVRDEVLGISNRVLH